MSLVFGIKAVRSGNTSAWTPIVVAGALTAGLVVFLINAAVD